MTVDPGKNNVETFTGGISWYMMEIKCFISSLSLKLKNGNNEPVPFNEQTITFRLSIKEV